MNTLRRWEPFGRYNWLQKELNDMFTDLFWDQSPKGDGEVTAWSPKVDIEEHEDKVLLHADLPGMDEKDIKLNIEKDSLTISGTRETVKEEKKENYSRVERSCGSFRRSFTLPSNIDPENVSAVYKQGVLSITLPKKKEEAPKRIEVKVG